MKYLLTVFLFSLLVPIFAQDTTATIPAHTPTVKTRTGAVKVEQAYVQLPAAALNDPTPTPEQVTIEAPATVTIDYGNPNSLYSQGLKGFLTAAVLAILGVLGEFIPGLRSIAAGTRGGKFISSGIVIFIAVVAIATYRGDAFNAGFFQFVGGEFLPAVGASGSLYGIAKWLLGLIRGKKNDPQTVPA